MAVRLQFDCGNVSLGQTNNSWNRRGRRTNPQFGGISSRFGGTTNTMAPLKIYQEWQELDVAKKVSASSRLRRSQCLLLGTLYHEALRFLGPMLTKPSRSYAHSSHCHMNFIDEENRIQENSFFFLIFFHKISMHFEAFLSKEYLKHIRDSVFCPLKIGSERKKLKKSLPKTTIFSSRPPIWPNPIENTAGVMGDK